MVIKKNYIFYFAFLALGCGFLFARQSSLLCKQLLEKAYLTQTQTSLDAKNILNLAKSHLFKAEQGSNKQASIALQLVRDQWKSLIGRVIDKTTRLRRNENAKIKEPLRVILGGGVIDYNQDLLGTLLKQMLVPSSIEFIFSSLGDKRGIIGAVGYAKQIVGSTGMTDQQYAVGVDVGGTNIRVALVDLKNFQIIGSVAKQKLFLDQKKQQEMNDFITRVSKNKKVLRASCEQYKKLTISVLKSIVGLTKKVSGDKNIAFLALSSAGDITKDGFCKLAYAVPFTGVHIRKELEALLNRPVFVAHDIFCGALGENLVGAGCGVKQFIYVSLGTSIGVQLFDAVTWDCVNI